MARIRRTQGKRKQALADLVTARYTVTAAERRPRVALWDDSYEAHDPQYVDETKVTSGAKVKFPYLNRVTESQTTIVMDATDASPRWLTVQPVTEGFDDTAEAVTDWLEFQYRRKTADLNQNARDAFWRWANMGLKYGNSYMYTEWDDSLGGIKFVALDPYDVYMDARYGRFYIVRRQVTLGQLMDLARSIGSPTNAVDAKTGEALEIPARDGGLALRAAKRVERLIRNGSGTDMIYRSHDHVHGNSRRYDRNRVSGDPDNPNSSGEGGHVQPEDDPFNATVTILEYYETHRNGMVARVIPTFGENGESLVFQAERNPWGACPLVPFIPRRVDNEFYGQGNGELVGKIADAMDYNFRAQLNMIGHAGWPPLLVGRGAKLRRQFYGNLYGLVVPVRDVNTDLAYMNQNISPALHQIGQSISQQAADFVLGESDQRRGAPGGADSATEAAILETAGNITDRGIFRKWHDAQEQLGHVCIALARVHMTKNQVVPVLGRRTREFHELRPETLRETEFAILFGGSPRASNPTQQIATLLNIAQAGGASGELDLREMFREVFRLNGARDPDKFLLRKDPIPEVPPAEEEQALLLFGQEPVVSEQENLLEHIQAHQQTLQQWATVLGPEHQRFQQLLNHFQTTVFAFQTQQGQLQQGAPGAGSAPSPFAPQQAGQPGQPASFQPAFADLNQQRQGSNNNAGGQAPGPTGSVPGRNVGQVLGNGGLR